MREIKFRGKRIIEPIKIDRYAQNGWVYGDLIDCGYEVFIAPKDISGEFYIERPYRFRANDFEAHIMVAQVDSDTVGQYTGLKDKNGVEIYEGDIVKDHYGRIMLVEYAEKFVKFRFKLLYTTGKAWTKNFLYADMYEWFFDEECPEVIGNIYDNPELLF